MKEEGMKIDDKAIAVGFSWLGDGVPDDTPAGPLLEAFRKAIEAYEAAKWRPIAEYQNLTLGTEIEVWAPKHPHGGQRPRPWHDQVSEGGKLFWLDAIKLPQYQNTLFRTIDPPPKP